ncbi:MAG: transglycosylase SLT domain-containing protein [Bacteroidaceae bacterium]|nr:transglycosylase SLT domain-containing protein [Bacteroidaceae bacterium]
MLTPKWFVPFKGNCPLIAEQLGRALLDGGQKLGGVYSLILSSLILLAAACTGKQASPPKESGELFGEIADTIQYYDLHEIQSSGIIIAGTLSGPDTYYEYHGKEMGLQFNLAEEFAQSIGVRLQMEISPDTATLLTRLKKGEIDFIALEMPHWQTRTDESLLSEAIANWWEPERVVRLKTAIDQQPTYTVHRRMRPVMRDAAHGIISAYDDLFRRYSNTAGWDWRLLAAQCYQESGFDPQAVSSMGAQGLMQLMPATADAMGVPGDKRFDPEQNISAAARYIRKVTQSFADIKDADERIRFTLAAYNGGVGHVQDAQTLARKAGRNPQLWREVAPFILLLAQPRYYRDPDVINGYMRGSETEAYVRLIMERWGQYRGSARAFSNASTPAPAKRSLKDGEYQSNVKKPDSIGSEGEKVKN